MPRAVESCLCARCLSTTAGVNLILAVLGKFRTPTIEPTAHLLRFSQSFRVISYFVCSERALLYCGCSRLQCVSLRLSIFFARGRRTYASKLVKLRYESAHSAWALLLNLKIQSRKCTRVSLTASRFRIKISCDFSLRAVAYQPSQRFVTNRASVKSVTTRLSITFECEWSLDGSAATNQGLR